MDPDGVVAEALEVLEIAEVAALLRTEPGAGPFTQAERRYAESKSDPERRLAARLAAKRAACRALGGALDLGEVEVVRGRAGPPTLRLSPRAQERLAAQGASRVLVSLSHGQTHAAASVLLLRDPP